MPRVLIVDDEKDVVDYIREELKIAGYQTGVAYDGVEAVLLVLDGGWDVVMMDIRIPKLDGINALRIMQRVAPKVPVVIFTGQAAQGELINSTQLGAFTYLMKPVSPEMLAATMSQIMGETK
jgi:DNA-binding NtrC family response regulator